MFRQAFAASLASLVCLGLFAAPAIGQTFPDRPIRIVVPNPPGGGVDTMSRIVGKKLQDILGQSVVIENKPGAQGSLGVAGALKSKPDGYTIAALPGDTMVINPHIYSNMGFDTLKDVVPVVQAITHYMVLVANPNVPIVTMKDLENRARDNPGKMTYATSGAQPQVMGEYFKLLTKTDLLHVRFNGAGPASLATISGTTDLMISSGAGTVPFIKSGKLRPIAVLSKERMEAIPDVPTAVEAGYPELGDLPQWYGYAVPVGTPPEIVAKLNAAFVTVLNDPEVAKSLRGVGMIPSAGTPEEFGSRMRSDFEHWGKIVKATGVKGE